MQTRLLEPPQLPLRCWPREQLLRQRWHWWSCVWYSPLQLLQSPSESHARQPADLPLAPQQREPSQLPLLQFASAEQTPLSLVFDGGVHPTFLQHLQGDVPPGCV